jgi:hypothetical protein
MPKKPYSRSEDSYIYHDILPSFADYGYPAAGDTENLKIKGDVRIRMGATYKEPDVIFYAEGIPVLLVESKKPGKSLEAAEEQARSYIRNFPIERHSRDGRPPQYAAVTVGKVIFLYRYEKDINKYGGIIDRLESMPGILTYEELRRLYGLEEAEKPRVTADKFKDIFYQLVVALDVKNERRITPMLILETVRLFFEYLKDDKNYTGRYPYTKLDRHPDRQRWIRSLFRQYDWGDTGDEVASRFREEIMRSFQGTKRLNQFITPWPVVEFMTRLVGIEPDDTVLDFECGSGGFLAAAVRSDVPLDKVKGVDIADLPYYVSKLYLALDFKIRGRRIDSIPVFNDNGLVYWGHNWSVVIGNPAGGITYDPAGELADLDEVYKSLERDLDQNGRDDPAWEYNFSVQQAVRSAKLGGRICLVLPEGFFTNSSAEFLRRYVAKYCKVIAIVSLPRGVFYVGTTTRQVKTGRQVRNQKMSILLAEKKQDVVDGGGVNMNFDSIEYPVFLASVQKPSYAANAHDWLEVSLKRVLEEFDSWTSYDCLTENQKALRFIKPHSKKKDSRQTELY